MGVNLMGLELEFGAGTDYKRREELEKRENSRTLLGEKRRSRSRSGDIVFCLTPQFHPTPNFPPAAAAAGSRSIFDLALWADKAQKTGPPFLRI